MTNKLTHKQAYEIVRDNTTWAYVYPQDVKFKYGWIFHRTRDCLNGKYHTCKEPIDCYAIDSLYSYEHTGYSIEAWSGCDVEKSPFKPKNDEATIETIRELNRSYRKHKDDDFIKKVYEIALGISLVGSSTFREIKEKYSRDDILEKLIELSSNSQEENS